MSNASFPEVYANEKVLTQLRTQEVESLIQHVTERTIEVLRSECEHELSRKVGRFTFTADWDTHLGWMDEFNANRSRKQKPQKWVNSKKAAKFAAALFPAYFEQVKLYAEEYVTEILDAGNTSLAKYLVYDFYAEILAASFSSGHGAGSRPLINDLAFEKVSRLTELLDRTLKRECICTGQKNPASRMDYIGRFKTLSQKYWTKYVKNLNGMSDNEESGEYSSFLNEQSDNPWTGVWDDDMPSTVGTYANQLAGRASAEYGIKYEVDLSLQKKYQEEITSLKTQIEQCTRDLQMYRAQLKQKDDALRFQQSQLQSIRSILHGPMMQPCVPSFAVDSVNNVAFPSLRGPTIGVLPRMNGEIPQQIQPTSSDTYMTDVC